MFIPITAKALEKIKQIRSQKNIPPHYHLRLLVEGGGGCGGARFRLGFDTKKDEDEAFEIEGLTVIYQKKQLLYLIDKEIDYEERQEAAGFVFNKAAQMH
ncbi:HesB/IscA family protein [Hugenholtzia roseola]|uniref:HesB/IscA family protein n=1 Tax=Hugenholtzia roseola TaxID=1002 RepID=UPI00040E249C|nr:iron-sulfur cluster biosynthesis family protein [Hugenholtzia roseola]